MVICLEGCDGSGKTHLATFLAKELRAVYIKAERPYRGPDLPAFNSMVDCAEQYGNGIVVLDRHPAISEPIYGDIIRGGHSLDQSQIENSFKGINLVIYCRTGHYTTMKNISESRQMEGVPEFAEKIMMAYDEFFGSKLFPFSLIRYNYQLIEQSTILGYIRQAYPGECKKHD